jgi:UbiD family decarboxylase
VPESQDLHSFLDQYERAHPDDVLRVEQAISLDQDITGLVWEMARRGDDRIIRAVNVQGSDFEIVTNVFASRDRIERMIGAPTGGIHKHFQEMASQPYPMIELDKGPILDVVLDQDTLDVTKLPLLTHFETDAGPYITSGIIVSEHPASGAGNLSYHRAIQLARINSPPASILGAICGGS